MIQIPGYTIIRELGRGGMAIVYLALQDRLGRQVALKVMRPQAMASEDFAARFTKEGRIIARLQHPRIVTIYDFDISEGLHYFSMEYLPNGTLADQIARGLSTEQAVDITRSVAQALSVAHDHEIIHRDVKPQNILFRADGTPVLTDFGIARATGTDVTQMTNVGMVIGSPRYMSPEQCMSRPLDARSDLYSLGIVFYEMLTGEVPYEADDVVSLAMKHCSAPIPVFSGRLRSHQSILDKLLAKSPEDRFPSTRVLIRALDRLQPEQPTSLFPDEEETRIRPGTKPSPMPEPARAPERPQLEQPTMVPPGEEEAGVTPVARPSAVPEPARPSATSKRIKIAVVAVTLALLATVGLYYLLRSGPGPIDEFAESIGLPPPDADRPVDTERYERLALGHLKKGELSRGLRAVQLALDADPGDLRLKALKTWVLARIEAEKILQQAKNLLEKQDYDGSLALTDKGLAILPEHEGLKALRDRVEAEKILQQAKNLLEKQDYDGSLALIDKGLAILPEHEELKALRDKVLREKAEYVRERARDLLKKAELAYQQGEYRRSMQMVAEGLALAPDDEALKELQAKLQTLLDRQRELHEIFATASRLKEEGKLAEALREIDRGLKLDPTDPELLPLKAETLEAMQRAAKQRAEELLKDAELQRKKEAFDESLALITEGLELVRNYPGLTELREEFRKLRDLVQSEQKKQRDAQEAAKLLAQAQAALDQGDLATSLRLCKEGLELVPEDPDLMALKTEIEKRIAQQKELKTIIAQASSLRDQGQLIEARGLIRKALKSWPGNKSLLALEKEVGVLIKRRELDRNVDKLAKEAQTLAGQDQFGAALERLGEALALRPKDSTLEKLKAEITAQWAKSRADDYARRARDLLTQGKLDKALELTGKGLDEWPGHERLGKLQKEIQSRIEEEKRVADAVEEAQRMLDGRKYAESLKILDSALGRDPGNARLLDKRAQVESAIKQEKQEKEARVQESLQQASRSLERGDLDAAEEWVSKGLEASPQHPDLLRLQKQVAEKRREQEEEKRVQEWLQQASRSFKDGDLDAAEKWLKKALEARPQHPDLLRWQKEIAEKRREIAQLVPEMVAIKGGCFQMGSSKKEPGHESDEREHPVCIPDFELAKYEVRVADFSRFINAKKDAKKEYKTDAEKGVGKVLGCWALDPDPDADQEVWGYHPWASWRKPRKSQAPDPNEPVTCVSKNDAQAFIQWLNQATGQSFRLPTEAEWEYAARATTASTRYWGNRTDKTACRYANVADTGHDWDEGFPCDDRFEWVAPVGQFRPNTWKLYDMLGNVSEWTCSSYAESYEGQENRCAPPGSQEPIVLRGGAWNTGPAATRAAYRDRNYPEARYSFVGFRLARDAVAKEAAAEKQAATR